MLPGLLPQAELHFSAGGGASSLAPPSHSAHSPSRYPNVRTNIPMLLSGEVPQKLVPESIPIHFMIRKDTGHATLSFKRRYVRLIEA